MPDAHYDNPRLAAIYDLGNGWSEDSDYYLALAGTASCRVLDIGCNQGGFLRMLHDSVSFAEGVGVDLATERVALAEAHKGDRTLRYLATDQLSDAGTGFDVAFSHEVIYLIGDLADHARQVFEILRPGGAYYAVTCCHRDNPLWATWRPGIEVVSNVPVPDHSVGDIATAFRDAGFDVAINRFLADRKSTRLNSSH